MTRESTRWLAALPACVAWAALLLQLWLTVTAVVGQGRGLWMGLVVYFGFFTVRGRAEERRLWPWQRGDNRRPT